jgi:2-polyprenyl-3-methyl-5-hydroxy-6-metoxy-1,4-benzoquinol methylase
MAMNPIEFKNCLLCNSSLLKPLTVYSKDHLVQCGNCSFVFSSRIPTEKELLDFYGQYPIAESLSPITAKRYDEWLTAFEPFRKNNNILDVGCGDGYFLQSAKAKGWNVYGTEFTTRQVENCKAKGINMHQGILDVANYEPEFFDVIVSIEVIEHINTPNAELKKFNTLCRKGGAVYVTTPNFNALSRNYLKETWNILAYPEHLSYYTKKTLCFAFERNGFKAMQFQSTGISIKRIQQSTAGNNISESAADETFRKNAEEKFVFRFAKATINAFLTLTNKGDTLKGLFIKE